MADDRELVQRLLDGDERAFNELVNRYHPMMIRIAKNYCGRHDTVVEEVVQETWVAVLKGLPKFEGRASLKTWIFRILSNRAKTRGKRENRTTPLSALGSPDDAHPEVERFAVDGHWSSPPEPWTTTPEYLSSNVEAGAAIQAAIATLPDRQRLVITFRDVEGLSSAEVCNILEISDTNQRVLLHRARTRVRDALADYLSGER